MTGSSIDKTKHGLNDGRPHSQTPLGRHRPKMADFPEEHQSNSWPDPMNTLPEDEATGTVATGAGENQFMGLAADRGTYEKKKSEGEEGLKDRMRKLNETVPEGGIFAAAAGERTDVGHTGSPRGPRQGRSGTQPGRQLERQEAEKFAEPQFRCETSMAGDTSNA